MREIHTHVLLVQREVVLEYRAPHRTQGGRGFEPIRQRECRGDGTVMPRGGPAPPLGARIAELSE